MKIKCVMKTVVLIISIVMSLSFLAYADIAPVQNPAEIVKKADWEKMKTVTVTMGEMFYEPDELVFKVGQPYKLELINNGMADSLIFILCRLEKALFLFTALSIITGKKARKAK
jgi:hypothetical protein